MSRKTEVTAKNQFDRESVPGGCHQGNRKTLPFGETGAPPALLPFPATVLSLPAFRTGVLLVNFLSCSFVMAITRKQGRAMAPAPGPRGGPVVEPHSAGRLLTHPPAPPNPQAVSG